MYITDKLVWASMKATSEFSLLENMMFEYFSLLSGDYLGISYFLLAGLCGDS